MNDVYKTVLVILLFLTHITLCSAKKLEVTEIVYLETDNSANDPVVKDINGDGCALVKLFFPRVDDSVISGEQIYKKEYRGNEWYIYMPPQAIKFFIKYPGYETLEVDLSAKFEKGVQTGKTYRVTVPYDENDIKPVNLIVSTDPAPMVPNATTTPDAGLFYGETTPYPRVNRKSEPLIDKNDIYVKAGYTIMGLSGLNIGVGAYVSNFNIEANYLIGLSKSDEVYWYDNAGDGIPVEATYSPMGFDVIFGYGLGLCNRLRLTPRVGLQYVGLNEKADTKIANNANAISIPIELKLEFAVVKHLGLSLAPAYIVNVNKSEGYKALSGISDKIKGYADGFGLNISLYCNF